MIKQNYQVILEFDADDCQTPREAAEQIEQWLKKAHDRFVYRVIDPEGKEVSVDLEMEGD